MALRTVKRLSKSKPTPEGAGVHLRRSFGFGPTSDFDPFLLLDDFRNDIPADYLGGFPVAYVFAGAGKFCNDSGPLAAPTEGVQWLDTTPLAEADDPSLVLYRSR